MTQAVIQILKQAQQLSLTDRAELADRLIESLANDIPNDIAESQISDVRKRIAQVKTGEVKLIPGDEALAEIRRMVAD